MSNDTYTQIDPRGELTLVVGEEDTIHFLVCPRAMARASPAFNAMLYGQFKEGKPSDPSSSWTVTLPDDEPKAFEIILRIIHTQFHLVTSQVTRRLFFKLYVLADKYLMTDVLLPFANLWYNDNPNYHRNWHDLDYDYDIGPTAVREHLTISVFVGDPKAFWSGLGFYAFHCLPKTIASMRLGLFGILQHWTAQLLGPIEQGQVCISGDGDCNAKLLNSVKASWNDGILPLRKREDRAGSVETFANSTACPKFETKCIHGCSIFSGIPEHPGGCWMNYDWNSADLKAKLCRNWEDIDLYLKGQAVKMSTLGTRRGTDSDDDSESVLSPCHHRSDDSMSESP